VSAADAHVVSVRVPQSEILNLRDAVIHAATSSHNPYGDGAAGSSSPPLAQFNK